MYLFIYFYILLKVYFDPYSFFFYFHNILGRGHNNTILLRAPIWPAAARICGKTAALRHVISWMSDFRIWCDFVLLYSAICIC